MKAFHNSRELKYRNPFGAVNCCDKVMLRLQVDREFGGEVEIRLWLDSEEEVYKMKRISEDLFEICLVMPEKPGHVWYYFIVHQHGESFYVGNSENNLGGIGRIYDHQPSSFQITVSDVFRVPKWFQNRIMYQIFPDSFCNGNPDGTVNSPKEGSFLYATWDQEPSYHKDERGHILEWGFYGGNLKGITAKLDYLKGMGVGVLYLNPVFEAASPHRYDTGDYLKIDGVLGTLEDFDELIRETKKRDMGIILDGVFSHTGANSRYFNKKNQYDSIGAYNSPDSPYYDWYTFKEYPDSYECWWGVDDLPNVKEMNKSFRHFIYEGPDSVIRTWLRRGVMGFRLDVADELPEDFIRGIRETLEEENPQAVLIGEVWEDASNKISYGELRNYFEGDQLHTVMNYPFYNGFLDFALRKLSAGGLTDILLCIYENYPKQAILSAMNLIGSHDRARILSLLNQGDRELAVRKLFMLSALQMALPGVPTIYYGDEAGLEGGTDPYNRGTYPWGREDPRIMEWYHRITRVRRESLQDMLEELPEIDFIGESLLVMRYKNKHKEIYVFVNNEECESIPFSLIPGLDGETRCTELLEGMEIPLSAKGTYEISIPPIKTLLFCVTLSQ